MAGYQLSFNREIGKPQDFSSDGTDGIGFINFWGLSPAKDLLGDFKRLLPASVLTEDLFTSADAVNTGKSGKGEEKKVTKSLEELLMADDDELARNLADHTEMASSEDSEYYNILLSGGADLRHVIKTVTKYHLLNDPKSGESKDQTRLKKKLRFFLHDREPEVLARHVLFMQIINNTTLAPRERVEIFLSLFGNALVREKDSAYLNDQVKLVNGIVSETKKGHGLSKLFDFSHLRFKDRDAVESAILGWRSNVPFDAVQLRDQRCRGFYRSRFEYRKNLMDADYQWNVKPVASIIHWQHYRDFCHNGVAYETRLANYNVPNRSLASYVDGKSKDKGTTILVRGFWADIINSPYWSFGIETHNAKDTERLFKMASSQHRHTAVDVACFNLEAWIREMQNFEEFNLPPCKEEEDQFPYPNIMQSLENGEVDGNAKKDGKTKGEKGDETGAKKDENDLLPALDGVKLVLLAGNLEDTLRKSKYLQLFDRAFFGNMSVLPLLQEAGVCDKPEGGKNINMCNITDSGIGIKSEPKRSASEGEGTKKGEGEKELPPLSCKDSVNYPINSSLKDNCLVTLESMKHQVHFEGKTKLGFRKRMSEAFGKLGFDTKEPEELKKFETMPSEMEAKQIEVEQPTFMNFIRKSQMAQLD